MQKKLIALAIAGLSSVAFAQSNVTIYGIMDLSYDLTNNGDSTGAGAAAGTRTSQISSNSSRIGFKGTEDLGDGLKAVFQIESGLQADGTGTATSNTLASRNTYIGLTGGFGTVLLGRHDTPYKMSTRSLDMFADHLGDNRNLMGQGLTSILNATATGPGTGASFDNRQANIVAYMSPDFNGVSFAGAYIAGGETATLDTQDKGNAISLSASYNNGPWFGTVAYERHNLGTVATGTVAAPSAGLAALTDEEEHAWKIGLGYKMDQIRIGFVYEKTEDSLGDATGNPLGCLQSDCLGHKAWTLGGGYTIGANEIKLAYTKLDDMDGMGSDTGATQWAVGVDRMLSKRTKVYAEYVRLNNDDNAMWGLTGAAATSTVGANTTGTGGAAVSALSLGLRHSF